MKIETKTIHVWIKGWAYEVTRFLYGGQQPKRRVVQTKQIWVLVCKKIYIVIQLSIVNSLTTCFYWPCAQLEVNTISFDFHVKWTSRHKAIMLFMKITVRKRTSLQHDHWNSRMGKMWINVETGIWFVTRNGPTLPKWCRGIVGSLG